jgi:carboxyl-terminal processing protease
MCGCRTYGKGLIQSVYQLEDGSALVVTIGKYLTPARTDIDREGIRPDFGSIPERSTAAAKLAACKVPATATARISPPPLSVL